MLKVKVESVNVECCLDNINTRQKIINISCFTDDILS